MTARRPTAPRQSRPAAGPRTGPAAASPGRGAAATRPRTTRTTGRSGRPRPPMIRPLTAIAGVLVVLTLLLAPYLHPWLDQQSQLAAGQDQVAQLQQQVGDLTAQRRRWDDPAYVKAQARERLRYVMPGDIGLTVLDDTPKPKPSVDPRQASAAVPKAESGRPWYDTFWQSVQTAGNPPS